MLAADPRPDWFLRWYYALLAIKPRGFEDAVMVYLPLALGLGLVVMPLIRRGGERSPRQRPLALMGVAGAALVLTWLTVLGLRAPWVPDFDAEPLTASVIGTSEASVVRGARLFHQRGCIYCHRVADQGGAAGPDFTKIDRRMSAQHLTVIILRGRNDMPAYGSILVPAEVDDLVAFLRSRQPDR
jgi:ubiquinol-cytochrome c reductase cytochrome b subunit